MGKNARQELRDKKYTAQRAAEDVEILRLDALQKMLESDAAVELTEGSREALLECLRSPMRDEDGNRIEGAPNWREKLKATQIIERWTRPVMKIVAEHMTATDVADPEKRIARGKELLKEAQQAAMEDPE